jgi:hypothetical protein
VKVDSSGGSERDEEAILNEWPDGLDICRVDVVGRWQFVMKGEAGMRSVITVRVFWKFTRLS